ncbi:TrkH family potassium uptake protein [Serpentinicella alkaliphila]|uniref:Trk system potassium uptake protein TrkH n=1 Tax=Serpentinicella alkaliphila TaxID=1734049 RepID=A0A4R2TPB5_9FIRM|nr:TrkH family potassium uptake protein [Serpentinicella alkaliphila]QUH24578.1 TrkH family potassium uptake protein [Serpentinicella alkaliphila]TCQ04676.1 trk system potassium uptake protein TrkH [Serpentinicella alkaliphila]
MNYGVVIKVLGNLLLFKAIAFVLPLYIAILDKSHDRLAFIYSILIVLAVGIPMSRFPKKNNRIRAKDALTIVTFGWILVSVFGSIPFILSGSIPSFIDAFFETVSGLTTTGATIIDDIEVLPRGILFWRSFTHWLGGMGILVLTLAIFPTIGVGGFQIFKAESPGPISDKLVPRVKDTATILYTAYLGITILQVVLLYFGGMSLYESLIHTFGTVGTGGFSTRNASVGAFNSSYITYVIAIFMIASGVNFGLYYELYKGRWRKVVVNSEFKLYIAIVLISILLITINMSGSIYNSFSETFEHSLFQVASITTTTGYTTANYDEWTNFSKGILFFLMFVGGSAGSTAGSIKVIRLLILVKLVKRETLKLLHPKAYIPVTLNDKMITSDVIASVISFFFLYLVIFAVGTLVISLEDIGLISSMSAVAATLGNIGPGFGFVGPTHTYSQFTGASKMFFSLLMLFGRLELFTMIIFLVPGFWKD